MSMAWRKAIKLCLAFVSALIIQDLLLSLASNRHRQELIVQGKKISLYLMYHLSFDHAGIGPLFDITGMGRSPLSREKIPAHAWCIIFAFICSGTGPVYGIPGMGRISSSRMMVGLIS